MEEITQETKHKIIVDYINSLSFKDADDAIKDEERKSLYRLSAKLMEKIKETSTRDRINYTEEEITGYINTIIERTINLQHTALSDFPYFIDCQYYTQYKHLIKQSIKNSSLSKGKFKCKALRYQRTALQRSRTIHELRLNASLLIEPMKALKHLEEIAQQAIQDEKESFKAYNDIIEQLEQLQALADERKRIIDCVLDVYNEPYKIKANKMQEKIDLLAKIEAFKIKHQCNDEQAGKVFNVSRKTIYNMRKELESIGAITE